MRPPFLTISLLFFSFASAREFPEVENARKICREKKGILISQGSVVACFDSASTPINDYYSPATGHYKPEKEDFDLLSQRKIHFYRFFREFSNLTVCNYTQKEIYTDFSSSMDIFSEGPNPKTRFEKLRMAPTDCKTNGTHMFALFADRKTAEMAVGLCATPDGRPYYDDRKYNSIKNRDDEITRKKDDHQKSSEAKR